MIDEKKLRPIVVKLAAKLCYIDAHYVWRYLRADALERITEGADDRDEYVYRYRNYLRMAKAAVKFMEEVK